MKLLALTGPKGCGKDTAGLFMKELFENEVETIAFADPIKQQIMKLFELQTVDEYDKFKRSNLSYQLDGYFSHTVFARHLVREIGMLMREYDQQQFVNYVKDSIAKDPNKIWVITDLRFYNELDMVREMGGVVVKVCNNRIQSSDTHITEQGFSSNQIDYNLPNHGTTSMLLINLKSLIMELKQTNEAWANVQII